MTYSSQIPQPFVPVRFMSEGEHSYDAAVRLLKSGFTVDGAADQRLWDYLHSSDITMREAQKDAGFTPGAVTKPTTVTKRACLRCGAPIVNRPRSSYCSDSHKTMGQKP
jgi:hypothetical protein